MEAGKLQVSFNPEGVLHYPFKGCLIEFGAQALGRATEKRSDLGVNLPEEKGGSRDRSEDRLNNDRTCSGVDVRVGLFGKREQRANRQTQTLVKFHLLTSNSSVTSSIIVPREIRKTRFAIKIGFRFSRQANNRGMVSLKKKVSPI